MPANAGAVEKIRGDAEQAFKKAVKEVADVQQKMMRGGWNGNPPNPKKAIQLGMTLAVKKHLSEAQATRYEQETQQRAEFLKQVKIRNLVARLDENLSLRAEQRDKLQASLTSNWRDTWCQSLQMFMWDNQYVPEIPNQFVEPVLDNEQKSIWRSLQKVTVNFGWDGGMLGGGMFFNDGGVAVAAEAVEVVAEPEEARPAEKPAKSRPRKTPTKAAQTRLRKSR